MDNLALNLITAGKCPVTGMPVYSSPEWTDIDLGKGYSATFMFIGERILLSIPKGKADETGMDNFFSRRNEIIDYFLGPKEPYFELKDYNNVKNRIQKSARDRFTRGIVACEDRILGFIGFNAPLSVKLAINVGKMLFRSAIPLFVVKDYKSAITDALRIIDLTSDENVPPVSSAEESTPADISINNYVKELVDHVGSLNWEVPGADNGWNISPDHPFKPVYEALTLLKMDIDQYFFDKKQIENRLRISEERLSSTFMNAPIGIARTTPDGKLIRVNKKLSEILGYDYRELTGLDLNDITYSRSENPWKKQEDNPESIENIIYSFEDRFIRKDGAIIWARVNVNEIRNLNEEESHNLVAFEDITLQKEAELRLIDYKEHLEEMVNERTRELSVAKAKAEEASISKSHFLANMSHEIRTPLNGIIGMAELAKETALNDKQKQIFDTMILEATSLFNIVNTVLDFSKIEAGKLELEEIPFDMVRLIEEIASITGFKAKEKGLEFEFIISPRAPRYLIGDPYRLKQILTNLTSNSLKFTENGKISVELELEKDSETKSVIRFSVKDTGIGIPEDKQAIIFESFTQADGSTARKFGGTGLGTNIARQLTELMGGRIGVESQENMGSTFWFTASFIKSQVNRKEPIENIPMDMQAQKDTGTYPTDKAGAVRENRPGPGILVVEDYITNQQVVMGHLNNAGYKADLVENGREAVNAFRKKSYDLILMDIQMPVMGGFEATKEIRKIEESRDSERGNRNHIPIIAMTAHAIKGYKEICKKEGMDDYISKPLRKVEFLSMVDRWIRGNNDSQADSNKKGPDFSNISKNRKTREPSSKDTPIDYEKALFEFEGDRKLLKRVMDGFIAEVKKQLKSMRQAIAEGNSKAVQREAHAIKGGAANLTAQNLADLALEVELSAERNDLERSAHILSDFEIEFQRLEGYPEIL